MGQFDDVAPLDIVLAEDDPDIAFMNQRALQRDGHHVELAHDGVETLEAVRQNLPDLLVLDMQMPRGDGFAVLEELRADLDTVDQAVVVLSNAYLTDAENQRLKRLGVVDLLAKWNVRPRALAEWIKHWAADHKTRRSPRDP